MLRSLLLCGKMRPQAAGVGRRGAGPPSTGDNPFPPRRFLLCPRQLERGHLYGGLLDHRRLAAYAPGTLTSGPARYQSGCRTNLALPDPLTRSPPRFLPRAQNGKPWSPRFRNPVRGACAGRRVGAGVALHKKGFAPKPNLYAWFRCNPVSCTKSGSVTSRHEWPCTKT